MRAKFSEQFRNNIPLHSKNVLTRTTCITNLVYDLWISLYPSIFILLPCISPKSGIISRVREKSRMLLILVGGRTSSTVSHLRVSLHGTPLSSFHTKRLLYLMISRYRCKASRLVVSNRGGPDVEAAPPSGRRRLALAMFCSNSSATVDPSALICSSLMYRRDTLWRHTRLPEGRMPAHMVPMASRSKTLQPCVRDLSMGLYMTENSLDQEPKIE